MKKVAFKGGLLIDGTGAEPVVNSLVLVEDDKIAYAGADREIGPDYEVKDITGKTIMPGLIDSHLHFSGNLTDDDSDWVLEDVVQKQWWPYSRPMSVWRTALQPLARFHVPVSKSAIWWKPAS